MDKSGQHGSTDIKEYPMRTAASDRHVPGSGVLHRYTGAMAQRRILAQQDVDLWLFDTAFLPNDAAKEFRSVLSSDELNRASRFHSATIRSEFEAGRAIVRTILSQYARLSADKIAFSYGYRGKPYLPDSGLHVNWSHSGSIWLLAVTASGEIGVDIEREANATDWLGPASLAFSTNEIAFVICDCDPEHSRRHFLEIWTRKEALLKASGKGLHDSMAGVSVIDVDGRLSSTLDTGDGNRWWLTRIEVADGAQAALATGFPPIHIRSFDCRLTNVSARRKGMLPRPERTCPVSHEVEPLP